MTVIEGAACLPEVPACRTTVVVSDPFVTMPEGPLWVQAVPDDGALGVTAVGAGSASERLPCSWRTGGARQTRGSRLAFVLARASGPGRRGWLCPQAVAVSGGHSIHVVTRLVTEQQRVGDPSSTRDRHVEPEAAVPLRRVEPEAAATCSGRFVAPPGRRGVAPGRRPLRAPPRGCVCPTAAA